MSRPRSRFALVPLLVSTALLAGAPADPGTPATVPPDPALIEFLGDWGAADTPAPDDPVLDPEMQRAAPAAALPARGDLQTPAPDDASAPRGHSPHDR